uniref:Uncharacterized protein n=1 Tax=Arundo donax TaxID=35708 RepID=A0A0A9EUY2_ARUDO
MFASNFTLRQPIAGEKELLVCPNVFASWIMKLGRCSPQNLQPPRMPYAMHVCSNYICTEYQLQIHMYVS